MKRSKSSNGPQFVRYFGPLLDALRNLGGSGSPSEVYEKIAADLNLSDEVQNEVLKSGQSKYRNQVAWARFYLLRAGLLDDSSKHGVWSLTERGRSTQLSYEEAHNIFVEVYQQNKTTSKKTIVQHVTEESIVQEHGLPSKDYRTEILEILLALHPAGFERLAARLLRESGFTQVVVTNYIKDGGIDGYGTLQINPFVSFKVFFQCKRYKGSVSVSDIQAFRGAIVGRGDKGILITTGYFTSEARKEAADVGTIPIELIDSEKLIEMLEKLEMGLRPVTTYEVNHVFFNEFQDR